MLTLSFILLAFYGSILCISHEVQESLLTFSEEPYQINASERECLVRDNSMTSQQVFTVPCHQISTSSLYARWYWFPDGRVRGTNGLCLTYIPSTVKEYSVEPPRLEAQQCKNSITSDDEIWYNLNERLKTRAIDSLVSNVTMRLPNWLTSRFILEPYDVNKLKMAKKHIIRDDPLQMTRFIQNQKYLPNTMKEAQDIHSYTKVSQTESKKVDVLLDEIGELVNSIKQDVVSRPKHKGQGVSVEIMKSPVSSVSMTFLSPKFELSPDIFTLAGINPGGPLSIRVAGYTLAPKDGAYTFTLKEVTSQIRIIVNGLTVVNQWGAPLLGVIKSYPPVPAKEGDELQIVALTSGLLGTPSFKLLWSTDPQDIPEEIPLDKLFPSLVEPLCTNSIIPRINCVTTFKKMYDETKSLKVYCPSGCLSTTSTPPPIYGTPGCYALHSSVCISAIHSGVLSERGGTILLEIDAKKERAQYEGVPGFLITSSTSPAGVGCGSIAMPVEDGEPIGLHSLKILQLSSLLQSGSSVLGKLSGAISMPTSSEFVLIARRKYGKNYLNGVRVKCDTSSTESEDTDTAEDSVDLAPGIKVLYTLSSEIKDYAVANLFLTTNPSSSRSLSPLNKWNRLTCQTSSTTVSLYIQYRNIKDEIMYPSATVNCDTTFAELASPLDSFVIRCSRFCTKSISPVFGYNTYSERSSACRSAYHAGVLGDAGGNVLVTKLPIMDVVLWSGIKNGIHSKPDDKNGILFFVDRPSGLTCIYPENPGGVVHLSSSSRYLLSESFRQRLSPISLHHPLNSTDNSIVSAPSFKQVTTQNNSDVVRIQKDDDLDELVSSMQTKYIRLQNYQLATTAIEDLVYKKLNEIEERILTLETELVSINMDFPPDFADYDKTDILHDNWIIVDSNDASLGPSRWGINLVEKDGSPKGLYQTTSIVSNSSYGTYLIYRHHQYNRGFITARVRFSNEAYGAFGFVVKYLSDRDFIALEINKPSSGDTSTISVRRMRNGRLGGKENEVAYTIEGSTWVSVAADFGEKSVRFFLNKGKVKTGINLDSPIIGGFIGFFTGGLRTQSQLLWDNIICGPLWAETTHDVEAEFGSDGDRTDKIKIPENAVHIDPTFAVTTKKEDKITSRPSDATVVSPTQEPILENPSSTEQNVHISRDSSGCVLHYKDPLFTVVKEAWAPIPSDAKDELWILGTTYIKGKAEDEKKSSYLLLNQLICPRLYGTILSVNLRLHPYSQAGLFFRRIAVGKHYAVYLDVTDEGGPQVCLDSVNHDTIKHYSTGTRQRLEPDVWYKLGVEDLGPLIKISLNNDIVLQLHATEEAGGFGLVVLKGGSDFRSFELLKQSSSNTMNNISIS